MKRVKTILASLVLVMLTSVTILAGNHSKVIAVVNEASWCPACQKNGERAQTAFMKNNPDGAIQFVMNDLSDDATKTKSAAKLKALGLDQIMVEHKSTGVAYFFDADSKKLLQKISVTKSDEKLAQAMKAAVIEAK